MPKRCILIIFLIVHSSITANSSTGPDTRMYYNIEAVHSGKVMDIQGDGSAEGIRVRQYRRHNGKNQQFIFALSPVEEYYLIQAYGSKKYLTGSNGMVVQHSRRNDDSQAWRLIPEGAGFRIANKRGRIMAVEGGSKNDSARITAAPGTSAAGSVWKLTPALNPLEQIALSAADAFVSNRKAEFEKMLEATPREQKGLFLYHIATFIQRTHGKAEISISFYNDAQKAGYAEPRLFEYKAEAFHDSGNDAQGASALEAGYREKMAALAGYGADKSSREYNRTRNQMLDVASAFIEFNDKFLGNYGAGPAIYKELKEKNIPLSHRRFQRASASSAYWAGSQAFGNGNFKDADYYYETISSIDGIAAEPGKIIEKYDIKRLKRILAQRSKLGSIRPDYVQKHTVLYVTKFKTRYETASGAADIDNRYTEDGSLVRKSIINQNLMARMVEAFTGGKLSISYERRFLTKSTLTNFYSWNHKKYKMVCAPDMQSLHPEEELIGIMADSVTDTDVYQVYWDKTGLPHGEFICFGGSTTKYPIISYTLSIPRRGFMENHIGRSNSLRLVFHEYFHTVERVGKFKSQDEEANIISYYPEYARTKSALDYWEFMFSQKLIAMVNGIGQKKLEGGWNAFSYSGKSPFRISAAKLRLLKDLAMDVPPARRKKSSIIQGKALAEEKKGRKDEAFALYQKAFEINPSFVAYYRMAARRASDAGNHDNAAKLMMNYLSMYDSSREARWLGNLLMERLGRTNEAELYYSEAYGLAAGKERARVSLDAGWRFYKANDQDKAVSYFEKGISAEECAEQHECLFLKGEVLYKQGKIEQGEELMKSALDRGLSSNTWYQNRYKKLMKKK